MPSNFAPKDGTNPYADYSVEQMYQFLSGHQLGRDVGATYEYSNLGAALLGHVLARRAGMDYEALVKTRITGPLGMSEHRHHADPGDAGASRHGPRRRRSRRPRTGTCRRSPARARCDRRANDMLVFLSAAIGHTTSPLAAAMSRTLAARWPAGAMEIALGWHIDRAAGGDLIWHNGGTGGYRTFIGYDPRTRVGVVVLSNTSTAAGPMTSDAICSMPRCR